MLLSLLIYDSSLSSQANCATTGSYWSPLFGFHWKIVRNFLRNFAFSFFFHFKYIGTHIMQNIQWKTALQSPRHYGHFFAAQQNGHTFSCKKNLVNRVNLFWPIGDHFNGIPLYDWEACSVYCISSHCIFICTYRSHDWMWPQGGDLCIIALGPWSLLMWYSKLIVEGLRWSTQ